MPYNPLRGHAALRRGRYSVPSGEYFLTVSTEAKRPGLTTPRIGNAILAEARAMDTDGTWQLRCATVMPDHIHLLIILGARLALAQAIARLKGKSAILLYSAGTEWDSGFYDHRLHETDDRAGVFRYIFLNPYAEKLIPLSSHWPYWYCRPEDWTWFQHQLDNDQPVPSWLQ